MFIWGLPFVLLSAYTLTVWRPTDSYEWFGFALLVVLGLLGMYLLVTSLFASRARLEKAVDFMSEGGDLIGAVLAVAVFLFAFPVTSLLRAFNKKTNA